MNIQTRRQGQTGIGPVPEIGTVAEIGPLPPESARAHQGPDRADLLMFQEMARLHLENDPLAWGRSRDENGALGSGDDEAEPGYLHAAIIVIGLIAAMLIAIWLRR